MALMEIDWNPDRGKLRGFGWICLVAFGAIGTWIHFRHSMFGVDLTERSAANWAYSLWTLAGLCAVLAGAAPVALKPLYVGLTAITLPIGFAVSHVMLGVLFYLVITPVGLVMRLFGRDPLCRTLEPAAKTYWVPRNQTSDVRRYYRQF